MECGETCAVVAITEEELKNDRTDDVPDADAIILYPSFGAPLIIEPSQPLRLFVLFDHKLHTLYQRELKRDPANTPKTMHVINTSLKVHPWDGTKKNAPQLFAGDAAAQSNVRCHLIKDMLIRPNDEPLKRHSHRTVRDHNKKLFGLLRPGTGSRYFKNGYRYLYELEIHNLPGLSGGLYNCAWELYDPESPVNSMAPPSFTERQDLIVRDFIKNDRTHHINRDTAFQISGDGSFRFTPDPGRPLVNHHPIYVTNKPKLNLGQLTDVHISSRQAPFRVSQTQVLPTADDAQSPRLGPLINISFDTLKNLLDQMGSSADIDLLVLTGDLVDFNQNFDPTAVPDWPQQFQKPATLWKWMDPDYHDGEKNDPSIYPFYIDMLTVYSLLHDFVTRYNKPIVMLTGNHEAYEKPYGISPRVFQFAGLNPQGLVSANEGIPADHNLTVYEATLLYGPAYNHYHKPWNFTAHYLEWFYMLFNPLSDVCLTYNNQSFTALEWEDNEQIIRNFLQGGGMLPRASNAISEAQLALVKEASQQGQDRLLLTHFTFASFSFNHRLDTDGEVDYANDFMSHHDEGSFIQNRQAIYPMLYHGAFTHVLSGHSHRAGLYLMTNDTGSAVRVKGHVIPEDEASLAQLANGAKAARLIVGASGGPIPGQNYYADPNHRGLADWSLDIPSGNVLKLSGGQDTLSRKTATLDSAKPRFAVALSFFSTNNGGVFKKFESGKNESEFEVHIHPDLPRDPFIAGMTLYSYLTHWDAYVMKVSDDANGNNGQSKNNKAGQRLKASVEAYRPGQFERLVLKEKELKTQLRYFLSITFTQKLADRVGYKQYNYDSPWIFPVKLINKQEEAERMASIEDDWRHQQVFGYRIESGEKVPDFKWYRKTFPNDYGTGEATAPPKIDDAEY